VGLRSKPVLIAVSSVIVSVLCARVALTLISLATTISNVGSTTCLLIAKFALGAAFLQPGPNTITINASQSLSPAPDQAAIAITVTFGLTSTLDDVTTALTTAGITGPSLSAVTTTYSAVQNGSQTQATNVVWTFTMTAPISSLGATLAQLTTAQTAFQKANPTLSLTFNVEGGSNSQPLSCPQSALFAQAQRQAQQLAAAAGVVVGPVLSLTSSSGPDQ
jgi:hypothetical protein